VSLTVGERNILSVIEGRRSSDTYYAPIARLQENREFIGDLMAKRYAMRALFGDPAEEPFSTIDQVLGRITSSAYMLINHSEDALGSLDKENQELLKRCRADVWAGYGENDSIQADVDSAVAQIERLCRPVLEMKKRDLK
jgi:hypothetical protein